MKIGVVYGGKSGEHEVSCRSAEAIKSALTEAGYEVGMIKIGKEGKFNLEEILNTDVVFPIVHGTYGEDGCLQGLLEMYDKPYVGAGVLGSAVGMDKDVQKRLLSEAGIKYARYQVVRAGENPGKVQAEKYPVFVKPANMGSSVGVSRVTGKEKLPEAVKEAFKYDTKVLIEEALEGREMEVSVLGTNPPKASVAGEVIPTGHEFYDYEAKYIDEHGARLVIPAKVTEAEMKKLQETAVTVFEVLECSGLARVDMFLGPDGKVAVNEINTLPGFTNISMYPKLWGESGITFPKLVDQLVKIAVKSFEAKNKLTRSYR